MYKCSILPFDHISLFQLCTGKKLPDRRDFELFDIFDYDKYVDIIQSIKLRELYVSMVKKDYKERPSPQTLLNLSLFQSNQVNSLKL